MLRPIVLVLIAAVVLAAPAFAGDMGVRTIDHKGLNLGAAKGEFAKPAMITSTEELAKAIADEKTVADLKKQIDFAKEKMLFFSWSGSGGDKLSFSTTKGAKSVAVSVLYVAGLTRDLRTHHYLLVVPKDATWKLETGKGK